MRFCGALNDVVDLRTPRVCVLRGVSAPLATRCAFGDGMTSSCAFYRRSVGLGADGRRDSTISTLTAANACQQLNNSRKTMTSTHCAAMNKGAVSFPMTRLPFQGSHSAGRARVSGHRTSQTESVLISCLCVTNSSFFCAAVHARAPTD
jgi:hypothetical protein